MVLFPNGLKLEGELRRDFYDCQIPDTRLMLEILMLETLMFVTYKPNID
jgi:hypothetical protein